MIKNHSLIKMRHYGKKKKPRRKERKSTKLNEKYSTRQGTCESNVMIVMRLF